MIFVLLLLVLATFFAYRLYSETGESVSLFILLLMGVIKPDVGLVVAPSIILYYGIRRMLG
jgi:hypothetical protein